ncbi:alpha/beta fold hydrolase [Halopiger xanaduensis]|uniref:Alpha/beta hydrolase fold protein n=1 Tax=Halopiger xanaduensis (strain DSM 18323 / JCM 14033 / SH-6) TaxID=797210 RepID=F8D6G7_HALXS|nr:alpha/beta hydrolase [Halopiger xanaduensis]AEH36554.1 alpha/beta hydrolase fold protein [Halopiger xanaduensis SH-6]
MTIADTLDGWSEDDLEVDDASLHYYRSGGDGRPFVVAHGITADGRSRIPLVEPLADAGYDVVTYDARGHGRSDAPADGYEYADQAADLVGLVDALELEDPVLYGHSMGGTTVAVAAATEPELPHAVVLEDPELLLGLGADESASDDVDGEGEGEFLERITERIRGQPAPTREAVLETDAGLQTLVDEGRERLATLLADTYLNVDPAVEQVLEADRVDPAAVFPDIEAPTLILKADADPGSRERHREAASHLSDGRLVHVDGAGHCVLRDRHERVVDEIHSFLAER